MQLEIESPFEEFKKEIKKMPGKLAEANAIALFRIGQDMKTEAVTNAPFKSGDLRRSIHAYPMMPKDFVVVGTNLKYARIQDLGGTIRPVRVKFLTIPIKGVRGGARTHSNTFLMKSKRGNLLIVKPIGKKGIKPLFVLKKSVKIKSKPFF